MQKLPAHEGALYTKPCTFPKNPKASDTEKEWSVYFDYYNVYNKNLGHLGGIISYLSGLIKPFSLCLYLKLFSDDKLHESSPVFSNP